MNWMMFARNDWGVYHDKFRVAKYVEFNKITPEQYLEIVGETYGDS